MRVLAVGYHVALGDLYLRLMARGHEVRVYADDADADDILADMLERTRSWRDELAWLRQGPALGLLVFEGTGWGETQDELRRQGYLVVGSSALGDRLELDRAYGQQVASEVGLQTAETFPFDSFEQAIAFVQQRPARYVLKFDGDGFAKTRNYIGVLERGEDMLATLRVQRAKWPESEPPRFVLMEFLRGVEVGVGGFFDGQDFLTPVNLDWEHKRFFPGNLGELTGEMGTLVSYRGGEALFEATLGKLAGKLRGSGYVGYINLNLIVNEQGAFPLEFTCRLGVPGFAILSALHAEPWDVLLERLVSRGASQLDGSRAQPRSHFDTHDGFAVGVVLTVPPFPYPDGYERLSKGALIYLHEVSAEEHTRLHYGELRKLDGELVTAGQIGYVMVVTGRGASVQEARSSAYALCKKVVVPNVRYRLDIGEAFELADRAELIRLGWL